MAVRLDVELKALKGGVGRKVKTRALLNSGYESDKPEIIIPTEIARELGFFPNLPPETRVEEYYSVSGKFLARKIPDVTEVKVNEKW